MGPLRMTPGSARTVQMSNSSSLYNSSPSVFQLAGRALGTYNKRRAQLLNRTTKPSKRGVLTW